MSWTPTAPASTSQESRESRCSGAADATPELAAARAAHLAARAHVTTLSALGVTDAQVPDIVAAAAERIELQNTPDPPSTDDLTRLLGSAL